MNNNRSQRTGLSVIEVLTSIVVAMIGVFGIMVMIPFSIKQSQAGLDNDAATVLARSAMANLEIKGYRNPETWLANPMTPVDPTNPLPFSIDPLAVLENGTDYTPANTGFPFNVNLGAANPAYPPTYLVSPASLVGANGSDMVLADARRVFRSTDELVYGEAVDDFGGPTQYFDANAAGASVRRQTRGTLSWSVLMVPYKPAAVANAANAWSYRSFVIVYKDRSVDFTDDELTRMYSAPVNFAPKRTPRGVASPVGMVFLEESPIPNQATDGFDYPGFAKGDWIMMVNRKTNTGEGGSAEPGFELQIGFYRAVNFEIADSVANPGTRYLRNVTLDGPDFDFGDPGGDPDWDPRGTHIIHLRDVVAVYERDIVHEESSNWNRLN